MQSVTAVINVWQIFLAKNANIGPFTRVIQPPNPWLIAWLYMTMMPLLLNLKIQTPTILQLTCKLGGHSLTTLTRGGGLVVQKICRLFLEYVNVGR